MSEENILIADTDAALLSDLQQFLSSIGHTVYIAYEAKRVLEICAENKADVVLLANDLISGCGTDLVGEIGKAASSPSIIIMSSFGDKLKYRGNVKYDELVKPFSHRELQLILKLVLNNRGLAEENARLRRIRTLQEELFSISGKGKHLDKLLSEVDRAVYEELPVLVCGEKGTGKETIARMIHSNHFDDSEPFVAISCSSFTEDGLMQELFGKAEREKGVSTSGTMKGKVELADGGVLYINDVESAPLSVQIRLLHLIVEGGFERSGNGEWISVKVKLIIGTSEDLDSLVDSCRFRADLLYRFSDNRISLPPLRECRDAIPWMAKEYLKSHRPGNVEQTEICEEAMRVLCQYDWPGNLAELDSCISHAAVRSDGGRIQAANLPSNIVEGTELTEMISNALDSVEKQHIELVLEKCSWNKHHAARELEISKSTLYSKINKYRLTRSSTDGNRPNEEMERTITL